MRVATYVCIVGNEKADKYADHATKSISNSTKNNIFTNDIYEPLSINYGVNTINK